MAGAIIDVRSGDILALLSLPSYDLNAVRYEYGKLQADPNRPMRNRALNRLYPPGSVAKPMVLIAGLESGAITPEEAISCPAAARARRLAQLLDLPAVPRRRATTELDEQRPQRHERKLQHLLLALGRSRSIRRCCRSGSSGSDTGGRSRCPIPMPPAPGSIPRRLRQAAGRDRQHHGTGLHGCRIRRPTPAAVRAGPQDVRHRAGQLPGHAAAGGQRLCHAGPGRPGPAAAPVPEPGSRLPAQEPVDLPISPATLPVVYDGMSAVVNERGGTAYDAFASSGLAQQGVKVYGKTGSTERPDNAWFAGFAEDREGTKIALAVVVEGGQRGGGDAGPLAREILQLCVEAGYLGDATTAAK